MPLYEYKCLKCKARFEVIQKITDLPLKECIKCGGTVTKTISAPAIKFKGSGWYITDYAKKTRAEEKQESSVTEKEETKKSEVPSPQKAEKQSPSPTK
jgi:putative FmdB family regulatory protein